ncbi:hypothetical protein COLO4_24450 [Corchorus olitorius]|uniref:Uncharacterized protein n=1 Tax=Corchorus olitorius TaxID=93759 RepID=A0A1R3I9Z6_9ROSI|nr:hypothetical protein COLO4_24450 [Corchorus olitorius]
MAQEGMFSFFAFPLERREDEREPVVENGEECAGGGNSVVNWDKLDVHVWEIGFMTELAKGMSNKVTFSSFLFVTELPLIPENDCVMQQMDLYAY